MRGVDAGVGVCNVSFDVLLTCAHYAYFKPWMSPSNNVDVSTSPDVFIVPVDGYLDYLDEWCSRSKL